MSECVFLVRHGETAWSRTGQHTGRTDLELTADGERDARQLGSRLSALHFARVFTSPLRRARRTCELAGLASQASDMQELVEWDYGDYEGKTTQQIREQRPDWDLFRDGAPRGEGLAEVARRADRALGVIRAVNGPVLVISSGHLLRVLATCWLGCGGAFARYLALSPASLSLLGYEHGKCDPVLRLWNETIRE